LRSGIAGFRNLTFCDSAGDAFHFLAIVVVKGVTLRHNFSADYLFDAVEANAPGSNGALLRQGVRHRP
jgi:hypothetical protein